MVKMGRAQLLLAAALCVPTPGAQRTDRTPQPLVAGPYRYLRSPLYPSTRACSWRVMRVTRKIKTKKDRRYVYTAYHCCESASYVMAACPRSGNVKVGELESKVWNYVRGVLTQP